MQQLSGTVLEPTPYFRALQDVFSTLELENKTMMIIDIKYNSA
jgi:hypothetical protein